MVSSFVKLLVSSTLLTSFGTSAANLNMKAESADPQILEDSSCSPTTDQNCAATVGASKADVVLQRTQKKSKHEGGDAVHMAEAAAEKAATRKLLSRRTTSLQTPSCEDRDHASRNVSYADWFPGWQSRQEGCYSVALKMKQNKLCHQEVWKKDCPRACGLCPEAPPLWQFSAKGSMDCPEGYAVLDDEHKCYEQAERMSLIWTFRQHGMSKTKNQASLWCESDNPQLDSRPGGCYMDTVDTGFNFNRGCEGAVFNHLTQRVCVLTPTCTVDSDCPYDQRVCSNGICKGVDPYTRVTEVGQGICRDSLVWPSGKKDNLGDALVSISGTGCMARCKKILPESRYFSMQGPVCACCEGTNPTLVPHWNNVGNYIEQFWTTFKMAEPCNDGDGSHASTSYPCLCGMVACTTGEGCIENQCQTTTTTTTVVTTTTTTVVETCSGCNNGCYQSVPVALCYLDITKAQCEAAGDVWCE